MSLSGLCLCFYSSKGSSLSCFGVQIQWNALRAQQFEHWRDSSIRREMNLIPPYLLFFKSLSHSIWSWPGTHFITQAQLCTNPCWPFYLGPWPQLVHTGLCSETLPHPHIKNHMSISISIHTYVCMHTHYIYIHTYTYVCMQTHSTYTNIHSLAIVYKYAMHLDHIHPQLLPFTSLDILQYLSLLYFSPFLSSFYFSKTH